MSDTQESVQDIWTPYDDEPDSFTDADDAAGTSPPSMSLPDQAPAMEILTAIETAVRTTIEAERKRMEKINDWEYDSKEVQFSRYSVGTQPQMIVREKNHRGDTVITSFAETGDVYIGLHVGILAGGTDTVRIAAGASRTIKTRRQLWAIGSVADLEIDVQEEYQ